MLFRSPGLKTTFKRKLFKVYLLKPPSSSPPSCSCRSLSLWSRRCKGWTISMNCLFPFYAKYFLVRRTKPCSMTGSFVKYFVKVFLISLPLNNWRGRDKKAKIQKNTRYPNICFCICYLNHRAGIVRRVTWIREVFARVHIDVDQALEKGKLILTIRKRGNFGVHPLLTSVTRIYVFFKQYKVHSVSISLYGAPPQTLKMDWGKASQECCQEKPHWTYKKSCGDISGLVFVFAIYFICQTVVWHIYHSAAS